MIATTHGRTGLDRFALGSVASRLVCHGAAALLLLRAFDPPANLEEVVVPLDGSIPAERALRVVAELGATVVRQATLLEVIAREERPQAAGYPASVAARLQKGGPDTPPATGIGGSGAGEPGRCRGLRGWR